MTRNAVVVPMLLMSLGCGGQVSTTSRTGPAAPLDASLLPPTHGVGFYVNKQAHVAIFDIIPGRGIGLIYPHMGREFDAVRAGPQWVTNSVPYFPASYTPAAAGSVRYLFLVASREPLNIEDYVGYSDYLRDKLSNIVYTGNAYTAMKALIAEVVPPQPAEDWTTALYIAYGTERGSRTRPRYYRLVMCSAGEFYWIPADQSFICPWAPDSAAAKDSVAKDTLDEGKPEAPAGKDKGRVLLFNPLNSADASDVLRRPVVHVDRPPVAPAPRSAYTPFPTEQRSGRAGDGGSSGSVSWGTTTSPAYTPPAVTTPAQEPSNPRGRVTEDGGTPPQ